MTSTAQSFRSCAAAVAQAAFALLAVACAAPPSEHDLTPPTAPAPRVNDAGALTAAEFTAWIAGRRAGVAAERALLEQRFAEAERACWRRFAVNACVRDARVERRAAADQLREDELALNAFERDRRTAARVEALGEKQRQLQGRTERQAAAEAANEVASSARAAASAAPRPATAR